MNSPVIIHIPHASADVPECERQKLSLSSEDLQQELLRMTDWYTDELFDVGGDAATRLIFPVSRLVVDPERFSEDADELMAASGMGAVYTNTSDGRPLRSCLDAEERERLLQRYYVPHHERLKQLVQEALDATGHALIIDAHSFPSSPLPCDLNQSPNRPEICLGTDSFHTPEWLQRAAAESFRKMGWSVELNHPYSGTITPMSLYGVDARVQSIMIEVKRSLYLDEDAGTRLPQFSEIACKVQRTVKACILACRNTR